MVPDPSQDFRQLCALHGLAVTHQRQVIYETLRTLHGHPSPEEVFTAVKPKVPAISLGTVYKTIHTFLAHGLLREVSPHHGTLRIEANTQPHHHFVCLRCRTVIDLDESGVEPIRLTGRLPAGFQVKRMCLEVTGLCASCAGSQ